MAIDINQLIADMTTAANGVLKNDITTLAGFSERQLTAIAQQTALVELGIRTNQITEETREFFLDNLKDMTISFVKTLRGLLLVTMEKIWNAMVNVIWNTINAAIPGIKLALPAA
jgi:hypothetical protein